MRIPKITPETALKQQAKDYLKFHGIFNYHILQSVATYPGLPDRVIHYHGKVVYLEFKSPKGKLGDKQVEFQKQCEYDGVDYLVIRKLEDLIDYLKTK